MDIILYKMTHLTVCLKNIGNGTIVKIGFFSNFIDSTSLHSLIEKNDNFPSCEPKIK